MRIFNPFMVSCRLIKSALHSFRPKMFNSEKMCVFRDLSKLVDRLYAYFKDCNMFYTLQVCPPAATTATKTAPTADFLALYERCVCNGLKTRINISNNAGIQEISITCQVPAATASARRRRRRHPCRRGLVADTAVPLLPRAHQTWPDPLPAEPPPLQPSLPETPPAPSPQRAKRMRKAAKRCCEVELLRGVKSDDDLHLSPPPHSPPPIWLPLSPSPAAPTTPAYTRSLPSSPQLLPSTTACTPDHSSPPPAPSSVSSPSSPPEPPSPPHAGVEAISATASLAPSPQSSSLTPVSTGPPTPPPWPEAYVFSTDPDRIVCRKCCNRHYNYRWYSHCFMCNRT
jgi:hypothetical protein